MKSILEKSQNSLAVISWNARCQNADDSIGQARSITRVNDSARNQPNSIEIAQAIVGTIDQIIECNVMARLSFELISNAV